MPFYFKNFTIKPFLSLLLFVGIFQACSSSQKVAENTLTPTVAPKNTFDPSWYNNLERTRIDSAQISVSVFVQASNILTANELSTREAKKELSLVVDDYVERIRKNKEEQSWDASKLIALRRFVNTYVYDNAAVTNESSKPAELGFYAWKQASIDKVAFDKELAQKFNL
jgi:hypothetical protein